MELYKMSFQADCSLHAALNHCQRVFRKSSPIEIFPPAVEFLENCQRSSDQGYQVWIFFNGGDGQPQLIKQLVWWRLRDLPAPNSLVLPHGVTVAFDQPAKELMERLQLAIGLTSIQAVLQTSAILFNQCAWARELGLSVGAFEVFPDGPPQLISAFTF